MKRTSAVGYSVIVLIVLVVGGFFCRPAHVANLWQATTFGVGVQGAWYDGTEDGDIEADGKAAMSLTPHISLVGGLAYGFGHTYLRESVGARITATDVDDQTFSVGLGLSRHFRSEPGGLDEWAGEAAIGWKPFETSRVLVTALAAYGIDSRVPFVTAGVILPITIGGAK